MKNSGVAAKSARPLRWSCSSTLWFCPTWLVRFAPWPSPLWHLSLGFLLLKKWKIVVSEVVRTGHSLINSLIYSFIASLIQASLQPSALANLPFIQPFATNHCCSVWFHSEAAFSAATPCPRSPVSFQVTYDGHAGHVGYAGHSGHAAVPGRAKSDEHELRLHGAGFYLRAVARMIALSSLTLQSFTGHIGSREVWLGSFALCLTWVPKLAFTTWNTHGQYKYPFPQRSNLSSYTMARCWTSCWFPCWASLGSQPCWSSWKCDWMTSMRSGGLQLPGTESGRDHAWMLKNHLMKSGTFGSPSVVVVDVRLMSKLRFPEIRVPLNHPFSWDLPI